jgi:hypothetical protein
MCGLHVLRTTAGPPIAYIGKLSIARRHAGTLRQQSLTDHNTACGLNICLIAFETDTAHMDCQAWLPKPHAGVAAQAGAPGVAGGCDLHHMGAPTPTPHTPPHTHHPTQHPTHNTPHSTPPTHPIQTPTHPHHPPGRWFAAGCTPRDATVGPRTPPHNAPQTTHGTIMSKPRPWSLLNNRLLLCVHARLSAPHVGVHTTDTCHSVRHQGVTHPTKKPHLCVRRYAPGGTHSPGALAL